MEDEVSFKRNLVKLFGEKQMKESFRLYVSGIRISERTKKTKQELKKKMKRKKKKFNMKTPTVLDMSDSVDIFTYAAEFSKYTEDQKIKEIASYGKHEKLIFKSLLENTSRKILEILGERHLPGKEFLSKIHLIQELTSKYFSTEGNLEKRATENTNISEISFDTSFKFVTFCDIELPVEILRYIFNFLKYDNEILRKVGRICSFFYVTILASWPSLKIKKKNVYKVSILALRNIRNLTLSVTTSNKSFRRSELDYIFSHVRPERLETIELDMTLESFVRTLRYFTDRRDKSIFENIKTFSYVPPNTNTYTPNKSELNAYREEWENFDQHGVSKPIRLNKIFPHLESSRNPVNFGILEGCSVKSLTISLNPNYAGFSPVRLKHPKGNIGTPKRDHGIEKAKCRVLEIQVQYGDVEQFRSLGKFAESFVNLTVLRLFITGRVHDKTHKFDVTFILRNIPSLEVLEIKDCTQCYDDANHSFLELPTVEEAATMDNIFTNLRSFSLMKEDENYQYYITKSHFDIFPFFLNQALFPYLTQLSLQIRQIEGEVNSHHALSVERLHKSIYSLTHIHLKFECLRPRYSREGYYLTILSKRGRRSPENSSFYNRGKKWRISIQSFHSRYKFYGNSGFSLLKFPFLHSLLNEELPKIVRRGCLGRRTIVQIEDGSCDFKVSELFVKAMKKVFVEEVCEGEEEEEEENEVDQKKKESGRRIIVSWKESLGSWGWSSQKKVNICEILNM